MPTPAKILIAPLDWGIGHAARIIPVIRVLIAQNCDITIASDGYAEFLLKQEFPSLKFIPLRGYKISYSKHKRWLPVKIFFQIPSILRSIYTEHQWLKKVVKQFGFNAIISDNRFGLYHSTVPSIYITHQLLIKTGNAFSEKIAQKIHYWFIKKYTQCWVPDFEGTPNVAGELSHPLKILPHIKYIGCLSRFQKSQPAQIQYGLLLLLSGPEPQRSVFEDLILPQLKNFNGTVLLIRGLPGLQQVPSFEGWENGKLYIKNHLPAKELNQAIDQSTIVISRSGYTTVMDLIKLQKKAILVPTPGQTEQEYLAKHLLEQQLFYSEGQQGFILAKALEKAAGFNFSTLEFDMGLYKKTVEEFVNYLK